MRLCGRNRANLVKRVPTPIPTLNLDFVNGSYSYGNNKYSNPNSIAGYSFGNATGGYVTNPNTGLLQNFVPNNPRITSNGLLVETNSTNLLGNSLALTGTGWTGQNTTMTANNIVAPDGTQTATLNTCSSNNIAGAGNYTSTGISVTSGLRYTASAYFKGGTAPFGVLNVNHGPSGGYIAVVFNHSTGVITSVGLLAGTMFTNVSSKTTFVGNGWWRVETTWTAGVTGVVPYIWGQCNTATPVFQAGGNVSVTAGQTNYCWGGQFEQSPVATSYIPTYGAITNLIQQSNFLATSPWVSDFIASTNNTALAPDGSFTASTLNTTQVTHNIRQTVTVTASTTYTFSFYAKRGTATDAKYSVFNVTAGTNIISQTSYYSQINSTTWTRVQITFTTPVGCTQINVYPMRDSGQLGTTFVWGCQLELGFSAKTYVPVSPAVTNYCLYSQQIGGTGWIAASATPTLNNAVAPDGTTTATLMTTTANVASALYRNGYTTTVGNQVITNSCWVKAGTNQYCTINSNTSVANAMAIFDLKNGVVTKTNSLGILSNVVASITADPRGNGWYRCAVSFTCANSGVPITIQISNAVSGTASVDTQGNVVPANGTTIYMWGAQQELGYGANQYVLTTTASASAVAQTSATLASQATASRTPDVFIYRTALGLSFANTKAMIAEGSFLNYPTTNFALAQLSDGTSANSVLIGQYLGNFLSQIVITSSLVKSIFQGGNINLPTINRKQGVSFGDNRMVISQNGLPVTDPNLGNGTFGGGISFNQLLIGGTNTVTNPQINGYVRSIKLYPSSLSLNQLNTLTSLQNN